MFHICSVVKSITDNLYKIRLLNFTEKINLVLSMMIMNNPNSLNKKIDEFFIGYKED